MSKVPVIDVHTHMLGQEWFKVIQEHGGPSYTVKEVKTLRGPQLGLHRDGALFMTVFPEMLDYDLRVKDMDKAGVDISVVSLTCPNVFWGDKEISSHAARAINEEMQDAQRRYPNRIRWFASLPWQYANEAVAELETALANGASGVVVTGNIENKHLTDPMFAPVWDAIDKHELPVTIHPGPPPGVGPMDMASYHLVAANGFLFDTTLALSRMIYDGFFDRYQKVKIITCHGGGTLPYIIGRLDRCYDAVPACKAKISSPPSSYMNRIFIDSVLYRQDALEFAAKVWGEDNMLFGSDYPHNIGDAAGCLGRVNALPQPLRDKVCGINALKVFNFQLGQHGKAGN